VAGEFDSQGREFFFFGDSSPLPDSNFQVRATRGFRVGKRVHVLLEVENEKIFLILSLLSYPLLNQPIKLPLAFRFSAPKEAEFPDIKSDRDHGYFPAGALQKNRRRFPTP